MISQAAAIGSGWHDRTKRVQVDAVDVLHNQELPAVSFVRIHGGHDIGMAQFADRRHFPMKARRHLRIAGVLRQDNLHRHFAVELGVQGQVDDTHAAAAEFLQQLKLAKASQRRLLVRRPGSVVAGGRQHLGLLAIDGNCVGASFQAGEVLAIEPGLVVKEPAQIDNDFVVTAVQRSQHRFAVGTIANMEVECVKFRGIDLAAVKGSKPIARWASPAGKGPHRLDLFCHEVHSLSRSSKPWNSSRRRFSTLDLATYTAPSVIFKSTATSPAFLPAMSSQNARLTSGPKLDSTSSTARL